MGHLQLMSGDGTARSDNARRSRPAERDPDVGHTRSQDADIYADGIESIFLRRDHVLSRFKAAEHKLAFHSGKQRRKYLDPQTQKFHSGRRDGLVTSFFADDPCDGVIVRILRKQSSCSKGE